MKKKHTDILIYIALTEEAATIMEAFAIEWEYEEVETLALTAYHGKLKCRNGKTATVTIVPVGTMGNVNSALFTSALLHHFQPVNIVVLGIAGSISTDLTPGDVFIPSRVDDYLANSAAIGTEQSEFQVSGNYYDTHKRLLNRFQNFSLTHKVSFSEWRKESAEFSEKLLGESIIDQLSKLNIHLKESKLSVGEDRALASGPAVVKGAEFAKWLKEKADRKIAAVEMESAGVYAAVWMQTQPPRVIAIRPISDIADERKKQIEEIAGERLRALSLHNAVNLLKRTIYEGLFEPEGDTKKLKQPAFIKKAFIVGGKLDMNGEKGDSGMLKTACYEIGKILAEEGIGLVACSPFDDSADYFAITGYANSANNGNVHLHYPNHPDVLEHKNSLIENLDSEKIKVIPYLYPGYNDSDEQEQAWSFCQLQALEQADIVIAIGGRLSKSANLTLRVAEVKKITVIPFSFLGGAAEVMYNNINWKEIYPTLDSKLLESKVGIKSLPSIIANMKLQEISKHTGEISRGDKVFISRSSKDAALASSLQTSLKSMGLNAVLGDEAITENRSVIPAIDDYIIASKLHVILWSRNFALSPWCYDELITAIKRSETNQSSILLFNVDGSAIVPTKARLLTEIAANDTETMSNVVRRLIKE